MKIAFTSKGKSWDSPIDPRFGRAEYFLVYDEEKDSFTDFDNREMSGQAHGAGPKAAQILFDMQAHILITGNGPGGNASKVLQKGGIKVYAGAGEMKIKEAYSAYTKNQLIEF